MSTDDEGCGCSRRTVLQGIGAAALVAGGCRLEDPEVAGGVDAAGNDGMPVDTGFAMCGPNICVDLDSPMNTALATAGGSRVIIIAGDKIMIVRTDAASFKTLSGVCTHAGCTVQFKTATTSFQCPCHQSQFTIDGAVTNGPAARALRVYQNDFDMAGALLTIML